MRDVLQVLDNDVAAPADLRDKALFFAGRILAWDPVFAGDTVRAGQRAEALLASGAARQRLDDIVDAQGRRVPSIAPGKLTHAVRTSHEGRLKSLDLQHITEVARRAGAPLDKSAGVDLLRCRGDAVAAGDALYVIHAGAAADLGAAVAITKLAIGMELAA